MGFYRNTLNNGQYTELVVVDGMNISIDNYSFNYLLPPSFNGTVSIGNKVTNCSDMFYNCRNFNQPITIPDSVTNCSNMFRYCTNFNQPITIPNSVTNCSGMFSGCTNFNQPITIPDSVTRCSTMFINCKSLSSDINFKGTAYRSLSISYMLQDKNNSKQINVRFNKKLNNIFNVTNTTSIVGKNIIWAVMTNGFYNATYNVYCYYNYAG